MGPRLHLEGARPTRSSARPPWRRSTWSTSLCGQPTPTEARHAQHHQLRPDTTPNSRHRATTCRGDTAAPRARDGALDPDRPLVARGARIPVAAAARVTSVARAPRDGVERRRTNAVLLLHRTRGRAARG